jgi:MFS transporter, MHS family, alpha-ketoglutarate permease
MAGSADPGPEAHPADIASRLRSIFGGSIGNLVEWYDWYVSCCNSC